MLELRRAAHVGAVGSKTHFERALVELQRRLWVVPAGVAEAIAWHQAFVCELLVRWCPVVAEESRTISQSDPRVLLVGYYLASVGASTQHGLASLFESKRAETEEALPRA
jgi:hypothetical protein